MKKLVLQLSVLVLVAVTGFSQAPNSARNPTAKAKESPLVDNAGDWTSDFQGKTWLRLALQGEKITGALIRAKDITTNDNGELKSVGEEQSSETVIDAVLNPDGLVLTSKDADSQKAGSFLMRLQLPSKQAADLKIIGAVMPPGMVKPKPWRLVKSGSAAKKPAETPH